MSQSLLNENHDRNLSSPESIKISIDVPDTATLVRILQAYEMDKSFVSQRDIDFSAWAVECLMDWVEVVEKESYKSKDFTYEHGSIH